MYSTLLITPTRRLYSLQLRRLTIVVLPVNLSVQVPDPVIIIKGSQLLPLYSLSPSVFTRPSLADFYRVAYAPPCPADGKRQLYPARTVACCSGLDEQQAALVRLDRLRPGRYTEKSGRAAKVAVPCPLGPTRSHIGPLPNGYLASDVAPPFLRKPSPSLPSAACLYNAPSRPRHWLISSLAQPAAAAAAAEEVSE